MAVAFAVPESAAKLVVSQGDLTRFAGDAIVNAANSRMLGGGGVDGAIHRAAGPELVEECYTVPEVRPGERCPTGEARITKGYRLPAKHVIHTVGPIYQNDAVSEPLLTAAYTASMGVANENGVRSMAFPAISCGVFGYPKDKAALVSMRAIAASIGKVEEVHFILFGQDMFDTYLAAAKKLFGANVELK